MTLPVVPFNQFSRCCFMVTLMIVTVLALWPSQSTLITTGWDKSNHMLAFFVLTWLMDYSWPTTSNTFKLSVLLTYGLMIEIIQRNMSTRFFSLWDLLADAIGLIAYLLLRVRLLPVKMALLRLPFIRGESALQRGH